MPNKGLLIPRIDLQSLFDATTIASPTASLLVYNTGATLSPAGYYYWSGSVWIPFLTNSAAANAGWSLLGNTGTNAATNFIGTTDAVDWVVKTSGTERMRVLSTGNVGIGTTAPLGKLHVLHSATRYTILSETSSNGKESVFRADDPGSLVYITMENRAEAAGLMEGTGLLSRFSYTGGSATPINAGDILFRKEQEWTSTGTTQDASLAFSTATDGIVSQKMIILSSGNVGIGTTTPGSKLQVGTTDATTLANGVTIAADDNQYLIVGTNNAPNPDASTFFVRDIAGPVIMGNMRANNSLQFAAGGTTAQMVLFRLRKPPA